MAGDPLYTSMQHTNMCPRNYAMLQRHMKLQEIL